MVGEQLVNHTVWDERVAPLLRGFLNLLARLLYASANIINGIVDGPSGALHRAARTSTADDSQHHNRQSQNCFHAARIKPAGQ